VQYTRYRGGGNTDAWVAEACQKAGLPHNDHWVKGYKTLCQRESTFNPNAINTTDYNAHGEPSFRPIPPSCATSCPLPTGQPWTPGS
jgi:hypothetical protein